MNIVLKTIILTIVMMCLVIEAVYGQQEDIKFEHLSLQDGLSQGTVMCILQDHRGFMWFGTEDGLNKYDGYKFTVYRHVPQTNQSLSNNWINVIHEDNHGIFWIGTEGGGIDRFDPAWETFTHYRHNPNNPNSLSHDIVLSIYEDHHGILWIGTESGGLNRFDPQQNSFKHYFHDPDNPHTLSHNTVWSIVEDPTGILWIGTYQGLNRFDPKSETFKHYYHDPHNTNSLSHDTILSLYADKQGILWIGTEEGGLNQFNPQTEKFVHYRNDPNNANTLSHDKVVAIYEDQAGLLWIGTHGGLNKLNRQTGQFTHYQYDPYNSFSLSHNVVWSIYGDRTGMMWVGAFGAINKFERQGKQFRHYRYDPHHPQTSLSDNNVRAIYEDSQGIIWIGTYSGGLNRFDRQTDQFQTYLSDPHNPNSLSQNNVRSLHEDSRGYLWIGTYGNGLDRFDPKTNQFKHYVYNPDNPDSLSSNNVGAITEDSRGRLWIGTYGGGLNQFDPQADQFENYRNEPDNPDSLINDNVKVIYEDSGSQLWIGTHEGLDHFERLTGRFIHYLHRANDPNSLSDNGILSIYEDQKGRLWIGTLSGLNQFNPATGKFIHYREKDGLANDTVYGILEDGQGYLWLSTNHGLSRFNPQTKIFKNYDIGDGLQSNEFNIGAYLKTRDGELFFGGISGFNRFNPAQIKDNPLLPNLVITDFKVFNQSIKAGQSDILSNPLDETKQITLSYKESVFSFEFVALNYLQSHKNQYAYQLEGFDEHWTHVDSSRRFVTYTNLDAGNYIFKVKGSNNDGIWNEEGVTINITITPPPWKTWWAYTLYIIFILAIVLNYIRIQKNKLRESARLNLVLEEKVKERTQELQEKNTALITLNQEKNEFLGIAAHDLKNPLSAIRGYAEEIQEAFSEMSGEEVVEMAGLIQTSSKKMFDLITNLLDVNAIESGKMNISLQTVNILPIVQSLVDHYRDRAKAKNITLQFMASNLPHPAFVDENTTHQVLDNLISNAVKYSPSSKNITVRLVLQEQYIRCEIQDEGPGLSEQDKKKLFGKFNRLTAKPTGGEHSTGLGLFIVKKLVEAMNSQVWCESELGQGATFIVQFPIN